MGSRPPTRSLECRRWRLPGSVPEVLQRQFGASWLFDLALAGGLLRIPCRQGVGPHPAPDHPPPPRRLLSCSLIRVCVACRALSTGHRPPRLRWIFLRWQSWAHERALRLRHEKLATSRCKASFLPFSFFCSCTTEIAKEGFSTILGGHHAVSCRLWVDFDAARTAETLRSDFGMYTEEGHLIWFLDVGTRKPGLSAEPNWTVAVLTYSTQGNTLVVASRPSGSQPQEKSSQTRAARQS